MSEGIKEFWRSIAGVPGYSVSSRGRLRNDGNERVLKPAKNMRGYAVVSLPVGDKRLTILAHRLVALAFLPNPLTKPHVNHLNGVRDDNRVENLEWVTHVENVRHGRERRRLQDIEEMKRTLPWAEVWLIP